MAQSVTTRPADVAPGHLSLLQEMVHHACDNQLEYIDLLIGDFRYKRLWADESYRTLDVIAHGVVPHSRSAAARPTLAQMSGSAQAGHALMKAVMKAQWLPLLALPDPLLMHGAISRRARWNRIPSPSPSSCWRPPATSATSDPGLLTPSATLAA